VINPKGVAAWGYGGQTIERGDWKDGQPSPNPADQANAWKKQTAFCEHELPGTARHDPLAYLQNRTVDWLDHQLAEHKDKPVIIIGHHNMTHLGWSAGLKDSTALADLFVKHRHVKAYIFGHTHNWLTEPHATGVHLINLPPTGYVPDAHGSVAQSCFRRHFVSLARRGSHCAAITAKQFCSFSLGENLSGCNGISKNAVWKKWER
jgi:hypothetical protein